ncbi:MAG: ATP-dependent DNA helicase RecG, partial [Candidatus Obscuribacterales bacterium]|nr:ATP-dependent DNA helicase RecG [Candidatus Obscuribacterales bacterium]
SSPQPSGAGVCGRGANSDQSPDSIEVKFVKGVGPKLAAILNRMEVFTVSDLIRHYPRRHLDFQNRLLIKDIEEGQEVSIFGTIRTVSAFQSKKRNISVLTVQIGDGTGTINITRFVGGRSNKYLLDRYKAQYPSGAQVLASGIVERDRYSRKFQLKNAEVEVLGSLAEATEAEPQPISLHAGRLVPVYPLTEGLSLRHLRTVIHNALDKFGDGIVDPLPAKIRDELGLMGLRSALYTIHFPDDVESKDEARRRLVFDELFSIQLQLAHRRYKFDQNENALALKHSETGLVSELLKALPFKLTGAQERVFAEIARDLASSKPLHRLVQGDVGSGKTVVALLAFMVAVENRYQGAMMAPTEILAEQHYRQFQKLVTPLGLRCGLVLGKQGVKERREVRQLLKSGQVHIAVGTHALLEDDVEFDNLGLIIIDEQHRFGVKQRARLKAKSQSPELLTMTATPIPRTLAMTLHGDLDVSEIDELPPGRKAVVTKFVRPGQRRELFEFVLKEVAAGRQIYVVFPLIDESESLSAKAATIEFEKLKNTYKNLRFGLMHGKLKPQEKDETMEQFREGNFDVLVSTTVIEVGVDVPNATTMIIENADRFGLAQLHQLRGRVGRGSDQSYCFLSSESKSQTTRERLSILTQTNDGFVVAEKDLEIRGPGEFLGYRQSGLPDLVLADLVNDTSILEDARNTAIAVIKHDPELEKNPRLRELLDKRLRLAESEVMRSG